MNKCIYCDDASCTDICTRCYDKNYTKCRTCTNTAPRKLEICFDCTNKYMVTCAHCNNLYLHLSYKHHIIEPHLCYICKLIPHTSCKKCILTNIKFNQFYYEHKYPPSKTCYWMNINNINNVIKLQKWFKKLI